MTTQTELRALLEDAAYAMGINPNRLNHAWPERDDDNLWCPYIDSADGAEMEAFLSISPMWSGEYVDSMHFSGDHVVSEFFCNHESKQSARRMASLRVAAAIGRAKREKA